jgi:predicted MFS family arabinose efflux permease
VDVGGAAASILLMSALVFGFTSTAERGWAATVTLSAFVVAVVSAVLLVVCERRHPHPVMPLAFFASMRSAGPLLSMLVIPAGQVGFLFFTTLLCQRVLGFSPIQTGLALVPFTIGLIATNQLTPRLLPRLGERVIGIAGLSTLVLGIAWMALVAGHANAGTSIIVVLAPSILLGAGAGATFAPVTAVIMHQAPAQHLGAAASLNQGLQQLGAAMGLAILTSVLAATGGLHTGLGPTLLATAAFPLAGLIFFGGWARRLPAPPNA